MAMTNKEDGYFENYVPDAECWIEEGKPRLFLPENSDCDWKIALVKQDNDKEYLYG